MAYQSLNEIRNNARNRIIPNINKAKRIEEEKKVEQPKVENKSWFEKITDTVLDLGANVVSGIGNTVEGWVDTGASLIGNVADWIGADSVKDTMEGFIKKDFTGDIITNPLNDITDASLLNNGSVGQTIEGVAQGIGQLLPSVALSFVPGGAVLSSLSLYGSSMGSGVEEALNSGASLGGATAYGAMSGGIELLSEKLGAKLFGTSYIDKALGFKQKLAKPFFKVAKSGLGRMAQDMVGEGLEEAFAEAVNPILKKMTYDPDAKFATFDEIWDSAVVGAFTSLAFGTTVGQISPIKNRNRVQQIQEEVIAYNEAYDKYYQDTVTGKINAEESQAQAEKLAVVKAEVEQKISKLMEEFKPNSKSAEKAKATALNVINASGSLKMGFNNEGKFGSVQDTTMGENQTVNILASLDNGKDVERNVAYKPVSVKDLNKEAYATSLMGKESKIVYQPTKNKLTPVMKDSLAMMGDLSKAFGHNIDYVIADKNVMKGAKGAYDKTNNVLYLREDLDSSQVIQETIVHEFTHSLEGTEAYQGMADFVKSQLKFNKNLAQEFGINDFDAEYDKLFNKYKPAMNQKGNLSKTEQREYVDTELIAKYISEKLFTDKQSIQEVCNVNPTLGQKILNWIKKTFDRLTGKTKGERTAKSFLLKAKNLYTSAIKDADVKMSEKNVKSAKQNLDNTADVKYSYDRLINKTFPPYKESHSEANELAIRWSQRKDILRGDRTAISYHDRWYLIEKFSDSDLGYQIVSKLTKKQYNEYIEERKNVVGKKQSIQEGISRITSINRRGDTSNRSRISDNSMSSRNRGINNEIRGMGEEQNAKRQTQNDSSRIGEGIDSGKQEVKLSLEDSITTKYGEGSSVDNVDTKNYNLIDVQDKEQFNNLLNNLIRQVKSGVEMKTGANVNLRNSLFNCLQNQKNNVYSKLAEINLAYEKTVSAYNKNNAINILQTFIQALGYNGVIDGKNSVVYDLNKKKENLLDYSKDRATARLDKAIKLFGETNNPAKAGWLLADGRFVDYNRDSANMLSGNILDYEDHWQIEKVFDTRRGTDAIDAFMAEGNIRLMPEAGGIELRGKPNKNQVEKLEQFIDAVIDKEGITLDLRPAGTTENHKPNPVFYDVGTPTKKVMQGINSYYNTGKIAKVVDGVSFSLDEDVDTMLNDWWDNLSLEDLNEMIQDELKGFDVKEEVKLSKEERRELYVKKLYEEGKLNSVVTKLVNKNPQMKEYFKDTQMNMKYNPLSMLRTKGDEYIVMFHGTPNKYFNEFSPSFIGDNGSVMGEGFYFTESLEYANDYKQRDGRVIATLLDIKKPLSRNKVTITKDELKTFIQDVLVKHKKNYLENFNNDIDFTVDYWMNHYDNDIDLIQGMHEHSVMLWEDFYSGLRDSIGYDGVIAWNKAEGTQAIVFNSNQIKDIFNRKPTKSADIRYSVEEDSDGNKLSEAQVEFFKDSKVRDENGNLKVVYHGTRSNGEFTEFSKEHISKWNAFGDGFYFTDSYDRASFYARTSLYKTYLNITNPFYTNNNEQFEELLYRANIKRSDVESFAKENNLDGSYLFLLRHYIDGSEYIGEKINLNVANIIKDLGYDGIISEGFDNNEYVVFESNQIKNIDNKTPTESPDIRYSLIESDGKELVALHNLSEEKLRNSIALGGLPVPSIAITKAEFGHSNFGDITLVLKPDAINPADLRNKVFSADAYSKRFPKTVNKLKEGAEEALKEKFRASAELIGDDVRNLGTYIETDSIDNIVDKLASKDYVKVQYLKDKGIGFEPIYTEYKPSNELEKKVVDMLIKEFPEEVKNPGLRDYAFVTKYILPRVADVKYDHYANQPLETNNPNERKAYITLAERFKENTTYMHCDEYFRKAEEWLKNKGKTVVAERATEEKLREAVKGKRKDIENYLREILTEYDEGMYYRNDRDIFDYYGNRRDFEQIYNKVTLASIVNYMSGTVQNTEGWGYGVGNVRSLLAKQYKTLEDIRADKDKIISPNEMDALKKQSQDLYFELCYEVAPGDPDAGDEIIKEISEKPYNEKSILRVLKQYDSAVEDPEVIEHIIEFLDQLKDYPTEYFEAKPQRAVMFDEVAKLIAPQKTSNDIIDFFKKKGVEIALYEYDDDDSNRRNIIKNLPGDMRFSVEDEVDNNSNKNYTENREVKDDKKREKERGTSNTYIRKNTRGENISISNDTRTTRLLLGVGEETQRRFEKLNVTRIYTKPTNDTQDILKWHSEKEGLNLFFMAGESDNYVYDGKNIFIDENATEQDLVDVLNIEKPIIRINENKVAHISKERWKLYFRYNPNAYITRMPIQQFLDMTTEDYVSQRQIYARSSSISTNPNDVSDTPGDYIYLRIDASTNKVVDHDGRHRLTNLLNSGNKYADIFVDFVKTPNFEISELKNIEGQFNNEKFSLVVAKVNSENNRNKIDAIFKNPQDNNVRYSLDDDFDISDFYNPSDDGFFNAEDVKLKGQVRDTEAIKYRAKLRQNKVFNREDVARLIQDTLDQTQNIRIDAKTRELAIGELFRRMNTQDVYDKNKTAEDVANFLINNALYDAYSSSNPEVYETYEEKQWQLDIIKSYIGKFEIGENLRKEIQYVYGKKEGTGIALAWGSKEGTNVFNIATELNEQGIIINTDTSDEDIFTEIYDKYKSLKTDVDEFKAMQKTIAKDIIDESELKGYRNAFVEDILRAYDEKGAKTDYAKFKESYNSRLSELKKRLKENEKYTRAYVNYLVSNKRAKELTKTNKSYSASVLNNETLQGFLKAIAQTGNIKTIKKTARARIQKLAEVYNLSKEGSLFKDILSQEQEMTEIFGTKDSVYDENLASMIEYIANGQGELSTEELILLTKITDGLIHLYTTYDKVFKDGKYVETEKLAKDYSEKMRVGIDVRNKSKIVKGMWRFRAMFDPHTVMRNLDGYRCEYNEELGVIEDKGFFTEMFQEITNGEVKANVAEIELLKPFGDFFKANKGFEKTLTKDKIKLSGMQIKTNGVKVKAEAEMTVGEAISVYLTSLRPQSNFYKSSVILQNKDKTTSEYSFDLKQINELYNKFTKEQKEYIKLVQKFFNEDAQKLKVETDLATLGYTNIEDSGVYFPINREKSAIAKNLGDTQVILDAINTYTLSFNKDVKPGAELPIRISNVYGIVQNHARGMGAYYGLSMPLKTFNRVFNKQIESMGKQSLKRIASSQMYDSVAYIDKLLKDIQGRQYDNTIGGKILRGMRGNYAKFQLGFNPKTILGQTSSYMMASTYLDAEALAKGLAMKTNTEQMFKYAPFTRYRMQEKAIVKAQGVIDKLGTWTDTFTKGIEWMDNNVVKKLWNASQVQIEKNTGHKVGTEENLKRASKLLEKVVRETQSNSIASEKTSLARSENEFYASLTMFSSDAQKQASRLVDGLGLLSATKQWIANGTLKADDKIAKVAKKQIFRAGAGFVTATAMYVLIGMMMKHLLGKNDEEETIPAEFFGDFKTQVAGLIPIYRDIYGFMNDGYELDNYAYGMINDALQGAKSMKHLAEDIISGKQLSKSEIGMPARKVIYGTSQLFGVPVRNVWNYGYGIINQFSPSTAYRMNSLFYDAKLTDLDKAIDSGNEKKSLAVIKEMFESRNLKIDNEYAKEVLALYKEGMNVIPSEIKDTFTYNGEELTLTSSQHKQLLNSMNSVLEGFNEVVKTTEYKKLNSKQRRVYLNNLYDINYILNLAQTIGAESLKESDLKKYLFASVLGMDLISYMAYIKTFENDKDKDGNTITNSKKTKVTNWVKELNVTPAEKYLLMGFAGYKNVNGENSVNTHLRKMGLSKDERELVMQLCGY